MGFKDTFTWGVATAAYQIEGAAYEAGKGLSIWDVFCQQPGRVHGGDTGDVACDHYNRYKKDIALMKHMGIKAYRFSISWPRVIPEGIGEVNEEGLNFYEALVDELLKNDIEPYVTLFHWDYPYALHQKGGWMNPDSPQWFAEYARVVTQRLAGKVKYFITMNEPQCFIGHGYCKGIHAPGLKHGIKDTLLMAHHVLLAHGKAVKAMRECTFEDIKIGYAPTASMHYPIVPNEANIEAARRAIFDMPSELSETDWAWNVSWWSDPVILGHYPEDGVKLFGKLMPVIGDEDMALISQPLDFLGQNIYNGRGIKAGSDNEVIYVDREPGAPKTALNWPITPEALYWGPKFLYERYNLPIYITENGLACHDVVSLDGKVHDPNRIDFLNRYLLSIKKAIEDGIDVAGYFEWSFVDNFEWHSGYAERFGIVYVDYLTQERIIKDSGHWYQKVIQTNGECL